MDNNNNNFSYVPPSSMLFLTIGNEFNVPTAEFFRTLGINLKCVEIFSKETPIDVVFQKNGVDEKVLSSVAAIIVAVGSRTINLSSVFPDKIVENWNQKYATVALLPPDIVQHRLPPSFRKGFRCYEVRTLSYVVGFHPLSYVDEIRAYIKQTIKQRKNQLKGSHTKHAYVLVLLTKDCWVSKRWEYAVEQAIKTNKKIITIHDSESITRFPSNLPDSIRPIMDTIAIKFIHQRAKSCWAKVFKRMNQNGVENIQTEVFLSHRQSSGQGIALALYNELTSKHALKTFLDVKAKFSLHDLELIVSQTKLFVFILSAGIFESYWCWKELQTAVENGKRIVFLCDSGYDPTADCAKLTHDDKWKKILDYLEFPAKRHSNTLCYDANYIADCAQDIVSIVKEQHEGPTPGLYRADSFDSMIAGPKLWVLGGFTGTETDTVYVRRGAQWVARTPMPSTARFHAATVYQGKIVVAGGYSSSKVFQSDGTQWKALQNMNAERSYFGLTVVANAMYAFGGSDKLAEDTVEVYNAQNNTWNILQQKLKTPLSHFGSTVWNNTIIVGGGIINGKQSNEVMQYDPRLSKWKSIAQLKEASQNMPMVTLDDSVYCIGGSAAPDKVRVLDMRKLQWMDAAPMNQPRSFHCAVTCDKKIVVAGGISSDSSRLRVLEEYNPNSNTWTTLQPPLPVGVTGTQILYF